MPSKELDSEYGRARDDSLRNVGKPRKLSNRENAAAVRRALIRDEPLAPNVDPGLRVG